MTEVVSNSGKFDEQIVLNSSPVSGDAKDKISSFVRKYQKQDVDEVFFYYITRAMEHAILTIFYFSFQTSIALSRSKRR